MRLNNTNQRQPELILNPVTGKVVWARNMNLIPGYDGSDNFRWLYRQIPGLQRYRIEERHKAMFTHLAELRFQKRFTGHYLQQDYIIKSPNGQITHLIEQSRFSDMKNASYRFLHLIWYLNFHNYRPEFYVPEPLRVMGIATTWMRHLVCEINRTSAESYCSSLKIAPALRRIIGCFANGKITVKDMMIDLNWGKRYGQGISLNAKPYC